MISGLNPLCDEYIGREVRILPSTTIGTILYETKNLFWIQYGSRVTKIPKHGNLFRIYFKDQSHIIDGSKISHRSENRIKKCNKSKPRKI